MKCPSCEQDLEFNIYSRLAKAVKEAAQSGTVANTDLEFFACQHCNDSVSMARVYNFVEKSIRADLQRYYLNWMNVPQQKDQIRNIAMANNYAISNKILVAAKADFTSQDLQLHLQFYKHMFDLVEAEERISKVYENDKVVKPLWEKIKSRVDPDEQRYMAQITQLVKKYLNRCGRRWIKMENIFIV